MAQLVPENVIRKIDSLGRITLPKGLRARFFLEDNADLELYTANIDGRQCIVLTTPEDENAAVEAAIELLISKGYIIEEAANGK